MGCDIMASGLTKARCVRKKKSEGKKLSTARRLCKVKGTYKGERRRTGTRAFPGTPRTVYAYRGGRKVRVTQ